MMRNMYGRVMQKMMIKNKKHNIGKRLTLLLLTLMMALLFAGCGGTAQEEQTADDKTVQTETGQTGGEELDVHGTYDSKEDVSLYLYTYGHLPDNYITKSEARELGWQGGAVDRFGEGLCIGGDYYGNYEGNLPDGDYHECDIDTIGKDGRGPKRLVYSDEDIYYTEDHYETFEHLYDKDGAL